jgi:hypothetical protein
MRIAPALALAVAVGALGASGALGCNDDNTRSHVYAGRKFEDARGCLDTTTSVDVVDGPDRGSTCDPMCIVSAPDYDSGVRSVFVSTMCPPLPAAPFDTTQSDPRCPTAIAAYKTNLTCFDDGGAGVP